MSNEDNRNYTENPVVQLAFENIRNIQNSMRLKFNAEQDIAGLLVAIPSDVLTKEDKERIRNLLEKLEQEKGNVKNLPLPNSNFRWSKKHILEWRYIQFEPRRDLIYKEIINIVVNRLHKAYLDSNRGTDTSMVR